MRTDLVLTLSVLCTSATAQVDWVDVSPGTGPRARHLNPLAYDSDRGRTVLFGGWGAGRLGDTWEWDGTNWVQFFPATSPPARHSHAMAYDGKKKRVVVFGGRGSSGHLDDTWEWDGVNWTQKTPAVSPSARSCHGMAYDSARERVVLYGGCAGGVALGETWEWDGTNWMLMSPTTSPPSAWRLGLAYDARRQRVLFFGGGDSSGLVADTWSWNGADWQRFSSASSPPRRAGNALAYDAFRDRVVCYGGSDDLGQALLDTWEWNGSSWTERFPQLNPGARTNFGMVYDSARSRIMIFGAFGSGAGGDTWEYFTRFPPSYDLLGSGCMGTAGVPNLSAVAGQHPWLGETFTSELNSIPMGVVSAQFGVLGASKTQWGPVNLPLSLTSIGMTGCGLYTSIDVVIPLSSPTGMARWPLTIPGTTTLLGSVFYQQALVFDPGANPLGMTSTNAREVTIGAK